jgi:hypothetical protein
MMKNIRQISLLFLLAIPGNSFAESVLIYPNGVEREISTAATAAIVPVDDEYSYCCTLWPRLPDSRSGVYVDVTRLNESSAITRYRDQQSSEFPRLASPADSDDSAGELRRSCFMTGNSGENARLEIRNEDGEKATLSCRNTALAGGFNTFASDIVFLEIIAESGGGSEVIVRGDYAHGGEQAFEQELSVESRSDLFITSLVGRQKIGRLVISHLGGPGSIRAYVAEYRLDPSNPVTGFTLIDRQELSVVGGN